MLLLNDIRVECHNLTADRLESLPEQPRGGGMMNQRTVQREIPTFCSRQRFLVVHSRSRHEICPSDVCVCVCWWLIRNIKILNGTRVFQLAASCERCLFLFPKAITRQRVQKGSALPHLVGVRHCTQVLLLWSDRALHWE